MRRFGGTIRVFTFKEGLLARAAHDLCLRFERFRCELDGAILKAAIELGSLRVEGPVRGGVVRAEEYDAAQRAEIERSARLQVLRADRFPSAEFTGEASARAGGFEVQGRLTLAGRTSALAFPVNTDGATHRATFELRPSDWNIAPYTAMLGAIRVQDRVRIELALAEAGAPP